MTENNERKNARSGNARGSAETRRAARRRKKRRQQRLKLLAACLTAVVLLGILAAGGLWAVKRFGPRLRRETYPVKYQEFIRAEAEKNGLDPALVASLILAESSYNPEAVSPVGARGLMQLMEETAGDIAGWMGEDFHWDSMFDPATNIRYGCYYLARMLDTFDGDWRCALAAYNQGPGRVRGWLNDPNYSEDGRTLKAFASDVATNYVGKILRYYERYAEIYAEPEPEATTL